jgi:hypothetical protein
MPGYTTMPGIGFGKDLALSLILRFGDDPNMLIKGRDPQMERVVEEVMKLLEANPPKMTPAPPHEDRTAPGLQRIY